MLVLARTVHVAIEDAQTVRIAVDESKDGKTVRRVSEDDEMQADRKLTRSKCPQPSEQIEWWKDRDILCPERQRRKK